MIRQEWQCDKVCRVLDDVLANRPTERDSLIIATRKAFEALEGAKWIPCGERLPEKAEGQYWVCTDTGYQCQCRWTDDVYGLGSSGEWAWKIFDIPQYSHVIAWMPLPEPWKGDTRE